MPTRPLADIALARSGDKGDTANVAVIAPDGPLRDELHEVLVAQVTADRVADLLGELVTGDVTVYEAPNIAALNIVMEGALGGGGPSSLRADNLGKALGGAVLRLPVTVPDDLEARLGPRPHPPQDPYAGAPWRAG